MQNIWKEALWQQFGASIDMLHHAIATCSDDYFTHHRRFYYIAFHSVIFLDYYLTLPPSAFVPQLSFTQKKTDDRPQEAIDDLIPDATYTPTQLADYVWYCRNKCKQLIDSIHDENFHQRFTEGDAPGDMDYSLPEILLYNMRHTQHHAAQLNLLWRQKEDKHLPWIFSADNPS